jgi:hypothetical protein
VNKVRIRFGLRLPIFKNAGVFVFYTSELKATDIQDNVGRLSALLIVAGQEQIANRLVCEYEPA